MARPRRYYYECIGPVDVVYLAPDHRRERWDPKTSPVAPIVQHSWRFKPEDPETEKPPDFLVTDRKLAPYYTDPINKKVRRKNLRTGETEVKTKTTKVPFRLLESWEVTETVTKGAISLNLPEHCYLQDLREGEEVEEVEVS